ncbi:MAG: NADH-quinone oxidoreductase subunit M [Sulfuricella sp.]
MVMVALIAVLAAGGLLAWYAGRWGDGWPQRIALGVTLTELALASFEWSRAGATLASAEHGPWLVLAAWPWIPRFGIAFRLGLDGLSLLMVVLTAFLGVVSVLASWREIRERRGFFYFNLLWTLAGAVGVFLALDLFLFFFFWELMLVPMYFLIMIWGHENRRYAALKFFIFTQGSGLVMLVAILALVFAHRAATGTFSFNYFELQGTDMGSSTAMWVMLGFFVAFAVKLPALPFHTWLPDAHTEAPTAGSIILAGVMLKTGAYGLLRFVLPLFPDAALRFAPVAMTLGALGIVYGALLAFAQSDLKRMVAYTSVSHLGFVLLGVFAMNAWALQGAVMQMVAHGISTGALFVLVGVLQQRLQTRDMRSMGGLWASAPRMGAMLVFFAVASLGLPGLGNFVGEFLILLGSYRANLALTVVAALGLITAAIYALAMVQQTMHGEGPPGRRMADVSAREMTMLYAMIAASVWLGVYPQPVLDIAAPALSAMPGGVLRTTIK